MDIDKTKIHMLRIADYSDKDKANILKNYMKNKPKDELYITTAYISYEEFPESEYYIFEDEKDINKKLIPVNDVLERENKILEEAGFVNVNKYVNYKYKSKNYRCDEQKSFNNCIILKEALINRISASFYTTCMYFSG